MQSIEYNLELAELMIEEFDSFLLSKEAFWPLGQQPSSGGPPFPRLSLGQLLLTLDELQVQAELMAPGQIQKYQALSEAFEGKRSQRPANLEKKALLELRQRANLWQAYVSDLRETNRALESYSQDVTHRVLIARLHTFLSEGEPAEEMQQQIETADQRLGSIFQKGAFIWHPRLKPLYGRSDYWYLYGRPIQQI